MGKNHVLDIKFWLNYLQYEKNFVNFQQGVSGAIPFKEQLST